MPIIMICWLGECVRREGRRDGGGGREGGVPYHVELTSSDSSLSFRKYRPRTITAGGTWAASISDHIQQSRTLESDLLSSSYSMSNHPRLAGSDLVGQLGAVPPAERRGHGGPAVAIPVQAHQLPLSSQHGTAMHALASSRPQAE